MSSCMAWPTQSNPVCGVVSEIGCFRPRLQMMGVKESAALVAINARPLISFQHRIAKRDICGILEVNISQGRGSALPVWVRLADQVRITRRPTSGAFAATANGCTMLLRQRPSFQGQTNFSNGFASGCWGHQLRLPPALYCMCRNFGAHISALSDIVVQIGPSDPTGVATEPHTTARITAPALLTHAPVECWHQ